MKEGKSMRNNKHAEFLKSIRLPREDETKENEKKQETQSIPISHMTKQEEMDLQKELELRFDEIFAITDED